MSEPASLADQVLAQKLANAHDAFDTALDMLALSNHLTPAQRGEALLALTAEYDRAREAAKAEHAEVMRTHT